VSHRTVLLDLAGEHQLARDLVAGGVFVPEVLTLGEDLNLVLSNGDSLLELHALCVYVDPQRGSGLQLIGCDADMKHQIIALASGMAGEAEPEAAEGDAEPQAADLEFLELAPEAPAASEAEADGEPASETDDEADEGDEEKRKIALNVNERLRGLTLVQQLRVAQKGELSERIILERMYGKNVWEALLRNARITGPEVARIARMGALPRPLLEIIVGNGAWLQIPEVRRSLLTNPRLGNDQIMRVLRLLPKHELKLAGVQTAYPFAVRDAAKRMLRDLAG
jgi:hypothetical protein